MVRLGGNGNKDTRQFFKKLEKDHGCKITMSKATHVTIELPSGERYTTSFTSSDWRSLKNLKAELRRRGLDL